MVRKYGLVRGPISFIHKQVRGELREKRPYFCRGKSMALASEGMPLQPGGPGLCHLGDIFYCYFALSGSLAATSILTSISAPTNF